MLLFLKMTFILLPICLGKITDIASPKELKRAKFPFIQDSKRSLQPTLSIRSGPAVISELMAGDAEVLECEAGGSPPPTIHWLKDGKKILQSIYQADSESENLASHLGLGFTRSRLYIDCLSAADAGKYTCVAENDYIRDSKTGEIYVVNSMHMKNDDVCMKRKAFGSPARVNMWTHTRLELMGTDVQLFCRYEGEPEPQVIWIGPNGNPLDDSRKYEILENGDLIIRDIEWSDMGGYTCHVKNSQGADESLIFLYPTLPDNGKVSKA